MAVALWLLGAEVVVVVDFMLTVLVDRSRSPVFVTVTVREEELFMDTEGLKPQFVALALLGP